MYLRRGKPQIFLYKDRGSGNEDETKVLQSTVTLCSNWPQKVYISVAFLQEICLRSRRLTLARPIVSVVYTIPEDSEVYKVIERGSLTAFKKLLNERKVCLNARDARGRSLLNVGIPRVFIY